MDCRECEEALFASLDRPLDAALEQRMREHVTSCCRCRDLEALVVGSGPADTLATPQKLLPEVLAKTSGSACARAADGLSARAADRFSQHVAESSRQADELLQMHLDGCEECAALDRVIRQLQRDLPSLAELDPGPGFASEVLRKTVDVPRSVPQWKTVAMPRGVPLWERLVSRPRLALEGAYAGTLALFLVIGVPGSPFSEMGGRALAEVRQETVRVESALRSGVQELADAGRSRWVSTGEQVTDYLGPCGSALFHELNLKKGIACWQRAGSELMAEQWQRTIRPLFERLRALWHQLLRYVAAEGQDRTPEHEPNSTVDATTLARSSNPMRNAG